MVKILHNKNSICAFCKAPIQYGKDAVKVVPVVLGTNGPIETEEALLFCSDEHAESHFSSPATVDERQP